MALPKKTKQPNDILDYDVRYSRWLASDDELQSKTITADEGITIDSSVIVDGEFVKVWLSGGTDGETYKVTVLAVTVNGRSKEKEFRIKVKEQ